MSPFVWIVAALVVAALVLRAVRARPSGSSGRGRRHDIDRDELDAAEREVRNLDPLTSPEEAEERLPDWGPGAPGGK